MNSYKKYFLLGLCMTFYANAWGSVAPKTLVDEAVAQVGDYVIMKTELETAYQHHLLQGFEEKPGMKREVLRYLINEKILLSKAIKELNITIPPELVEAMFNARVTQLEEEAGSMQALASRLGQSIEGLNKVIREQVVNNLTLRRARDLICSKVSATPKEVKAFFKTLDNQSQAFLPEEVVLRKIVQYPSIHQQEKDALIEQIAALKLRVQEGEDFADLAKECSQDLGSAAQGGEIGFRRQGELAPEYEAAALSLQPGELSAPVVTQFGFHLIQLIDRQKDRYNTRHILLRYSPDSLDLASTENAMMQLRTDILMGKTTFEKAVKEQSQDAKTMASGGLLLDSHGSSKLVVDDLPEDIFFAIESLGQGDISKPILYTTNDNREAFCIIRLEKRVAPHAASLAQDYDKIKEKLLEQKRMIAYEKWVNQSEKDITIKLAPEYQDIMHVKDLSHF